MIIVEDEKPVLELMKVIIGRNPHFLIIGTFSNPLEALASFAELQPDIAFLDVEMPKLNGLELAQRMNDISDHTRIIFTTAYREYALEAFKVYAFDYILKPVTPDAIGRITTRLLKLDSHSAPVEQQKRFASIRCFGGFEVRNPQGTLVRWRTRKTEELFAFFLCYPNQDINKWQLADWLWPDMDEDRASHNLHNTIYRLKKVLKEHEIGFDILKTNEGYLLETMNTTYDLLEFHESDLTIPGSLQDEELAERLCALYRGHLLERKDYLWKVQLEVGYGKKFTSLVRNLVQAYMAQQQWSKAERKLEAYLSIYALDEEMHQLLMDIYAMSGNSKQIIKHYESFESRYRKELGMEPPIEMKSRMAAYF
ncbi:response regulator [Paenibacillus foliorum]|uniref:response regulator n=1 Tax=Paenibacillus foliorum TaxID=2654974 RepID=UPI0028B23081|nr:response regulator [Paenibacillus foliorum]